MVGCSDDLPRPFGRARRPSPTILWKIRFVFVIGAGVPECLFGIIRLYTHCLPSNLYIISFAARKSIKDAAVAAVEG